MKTILTERYQEFQLKALRKKYSDEMIQNLCDRWHDPLLVPGSFERDDSGKIIDKEKAVILAEGVEGCRTFQELLSKRLKGIEKVHELRVQPIEFKQGIVKIGWEPPKKWNDDAREIFENTMTDFDLYGLDLINDPFNNKIEDEVNSIDLRFSDCSNANFAGADLTLGNFDGTDCYKAKFNFTNCSEVNFIGAYCSSANFSNTFCVHSNFEGADCANASFEKGFFEEAKFEDASLVFALFDFADLTLTKFCRARCIETSFIGVICSNVDFSGVNFTFSQFCGGNFRYSSFDSYETITDGVIKKEKCRFVQTNFEPLPIFTKKDKISLYDKIFSNRIGKASLNPFDYIQPQKTTFIGVDTSQVDWGKNPRMKRYIEQQQFVHAKKEAIEEKYGTRKLTKPFGWFLKGLISLINYLSALSNWITWAILIVTTFAILYAKFDLLYDAKAIIEISPMKYFYFSIVTFSTLGFGDITPTNGLSMILVIVEVLLGYVFLGGLITFLANWLGRR